MPKLKLNTLLEKADMAPLTVGGFLTGFFEKKSLSANQVAKTMGVAQSSVSRLLADQSSLTVEMAAKLAHHYAIPLEALFNYDKQYKMWQAAHFKRQQDGVTA